MISIIIEKRDSAEFMIIDNDLGIKIIFIRIIIDNLILNKNLHVSQEMSDVNVDEIDVDIVIGEFEKMRNHFQNINLSQIVQFIVNLKQHFFWRYPHWNQIQLKWI
jgi:hypothetical protein